MAIGLRFGLWWLDVAHPPACLEAGDHDLTLEIRGVKQSRVQVIQLDSQILSLHSSQCQMLKGQRVRVSWYYPNEVVRIGARMRVVARLRKPWGAKNPGGFDYGQWLRGQGYVASGYLRSVAWVGSSNLSPEPAIKTAALVHRELLNAVLLGQRDAVPAHLWALFRATGTTHLMVVSGLHVGIFVGFIHGLAFMLLRCLRFYRSGWVPQRMALLTSLITLSILVGQMGLQAPVMRASLMAGGIAVAGIFLRRVNIWRIFWLSMGVLVLLQPRVILLQGFWLSYAAVLGLLWYFEPRRPRPSWVRGLMLCQGVLLVFLTPWLGAIVGDIPLIASAANILSVPVMTLLTLPVGLAGMLLQELPGMSQLADYCFLLADYSLHLVVYLLGKMQTLAPSVGYFGLKTAWVSGFCAAVVLLPVGNVFRGLALIGWLGLLIPQPSGVEAGTFRVRVLDVGQGSAAIVDTQHHRLLVDTGPAFDAGYNSGQAVVIPALRSTGEDHLDTILLSHMDNDHAGGLAAVQRRYPAASLRGASGLCVNNTSWQWEGVTFKLLVDGQASSANDRSCTLVVSAGSATAYFSGDIGKRVERRMLTQMPASVDFLLAPHHGSASSSSPLFVHRLCARFVVFSAGRNNRYGHPREEVVQRYRSTGSLILSTEKEGAITWSSQMPDRVESARRGFIGGSTERAECRQR